MLIVHPNLPNPIGQPLLYLSKSHAREIRQNGPTLQNVAMTVAILPFKDQ